jgi:hypothetical protein
MTHEELVEKVENDLRYWLEPPHVLWERAAQEAVAVVLEEAAKVAERLLVYADTTSEADKVIPAAIRALGKE